jgi:hypothetical protein
MIYSTAISSILNKELLAHLLRDDEQEDLCFALWHPSKGQERVTALIQQLVLPKHGEHQIHGNASFLPSYFERVIGLALENNAGIAFLHSHLGPGWQGMSRDDITAEKRMAATVQATTGLPLLGLTLATDEAWSARFWHKVAPQTYERDWCSTVRVVGESFRITYNDALVPKLNFREELSRTVSAWGEKEQNQLMRLKVGIVGVGSVGSIIAESLARMGISHIKLIDFDSVELLNLDRILLTRRQDAVLQSAKVQVLARELKKSATAHPFVVDPLEYSISEEEGFRAALDCDVLFSCVDRPWARSILNFIAYSHLIPVIDGGIRAERKKSGEGLLRTDWRTHAIGPSRICLECLGQYKSEDVSTDREGYLDDSQYIIGLHESHFIKHNENVFAFSLSVAALEMQQFLALVLSLPGGLIRGPQTYHFVNDEVIYDDRTCNPNCPFPTLIALGDHAPITVTGKHKIAVEARLKRAQYQKSLRYWVTRITGR